jgi:hypothetical protein
MKSGTERLISPDPLPGTVPVIVSRYRWRKTAYGLSRLSGRDLEYIYIYGMGRRSKKNIE